MADVATMMTQLDTLRAARAKGVSKLRLGDEEVTYRSDAEMAAAISDLESRLAAAQGRTIRTVRFATSKGL
ncbi:phage head-tail joining protein [Oceaniglobus roseus]|uniref:phage head-tail joining protein n=1 Tax=Oceaniglobus roseus TaxID=1737570 RepID=UPI001C12ACB7|nr:hypothetical protein [Kandeliimicrobium roseum]